MSKKDYGTPYTPSQRQVIEDRGSDMLVSASAGTGKTTVMIERIAELLEHEADISEIVVVTFTNLAAAEMKNRLAAKLASKRNNKRVVDQLERIDSANISTLHAFCGDLLRNYLYVGDIDPSYTILDVNVTANLRKTAMDEVFKQYFDEQDEIFYKVYKIFATGRKQSKFYDTLLALYEFSRCIADFNGWYREKRERLLNLDDDSDVIKTLFDDIKKNVAVFIGEFERLEQIAESEDLAIASVIRQNADNLKAVRLDCYGHALYDLYKLSIINLGSRTTKGKTELQLEIEKAVRADFTSLNKKYDKFYRDIANLCRGLDMQTLREQVAVTVTQIDKLVEIVDRFDKAYYALKKERGGVDFNDLEHLTLKILDDNEAYQAIRAKCKYIFVDEYQDTNPVQEEIISRLSSPDRLFMVGDVKQSIYGFRGCEPNIFADKEKRFETCGQGEVVRLNDNFRSNVDILEFVNLVFSSIMTEDFGKVDYLRSAQLKGANLPVLPQTPSVRIDFVTPKPRGGQKIDDDEEVDIYDITAETDNSVIDKESAIVVKRIKEYVGMRYADKNGAEKIIGYGDIVILLRTFKDNAVNLYNALVSANIPVVANFNMDGYASKEIRDLINLMRALDNPYDDAPLVGVCLSCFGKFSESELGAVRLNNPERMPFYDRLKQYADNGGDLSLRDKIVKLLELLDKLRFYSQSASVSEVVLETIKLTQYHLYVQGLPNSVLRLRKMYNFIDTIKDASYAQSVDRFLSYIDETEKNTLSDSVGATNAVRMMTMHASKGLEFPVLIIADLQREFKHDYSQLRYNFDIGIAMDYYDFDAMTCAPTLTSKAVAMRNKIKSNEEQMRLLYVAMTRAKYVLNLVGAASLDDINKAPDDPQRATSHLGWLLYFIKNNLKLTDNGSENVFKTDKWEINVYDEVKTDADSEADVDVSDRLIEQQTDEQAITEKINYRYPYSSQRDMPIKLVSSALDKAYIGVHDESEAVFVQDDDRNYVGTAYHKVYQYVDYDSDAEQIKQTIEALVANEQIERRFADKLDVELIYNTLHNPELRKVMSQGKIYHEIPFMLYCPYDKVAKDGKYTDEVMLQGVIDMLVIGDDSATVVDFKYTMHSDRVKDNYTAQLNSYKLAVTEICGITNVDCYVLSIADNKLIKF